MKIHRFYIENFDEKTISHKEKVFQMKKVLRLKEGEVIQAFDNGVEWDLEIAGFEKDSVSIKVLERRDGSMPDREVTLFMSLIKKDNFEWVVEKATELGVTEIIPVLSERSEKKNINLERLQKIAEEASEQSGRTVLPTIRDIVDVKEAMLLASKDTAAIFDRDGVQGDVLGQLCINQIFIGPEGGWSESELELFNDAGIRSVSLGLLTLRAETAAVAALAKVTL